MPCILRLSKRPRKQASDGSGTFQQTPFEELGTGPRGVNRLSGTSLGPNQKQQQQPVATHRYKLA